MQQVNGREMRIPPLVMIIDMDVCLTGWGAATNGHKLKGHWTVEERQEQINILELQAILLTVKAMLKEKSHIHVPFRADNTKAVSHISPDKVCKRSMGILLQEEDIDISRIPSREHECLS